MVNVISFIPNIFSDSIVLVVFYDFYLTVIAQNKKFIYKVFRTIDFFMITHGLFVIVQCGLFLLSSSLAIGIFIRSRLNRLNDQLHRMAFCCRIRNSQAISTKKPQKLLLNRTIHFLDWIYRQHVHTCVDRLYSYQELWSNALFTYLIMSIPFNVIAVSGLVVEQLTWFEMIIQYMIIVIHTAMTIVSLLQFSRQTRLLHEAKLYLVPIIQSIVIIHRPPIAINCISTKTLRLKLKYEDLYNRLTHRRKYGPYVSTVGVVTNMFIFDVNYNLNFFFNN